MHNESMNGQSAIVGEMTPGKSDGPSKRPYSTGSVPPFGEQTRFTDLAFADMLERSSNLSSSPFLLANSNFGQNNALGPSGTAAPGNAEEMIQRWSSLSNHGNSLNGASFATGGMQAFQNFNRGGHSTSFPQHHHQQQPQQQQQHIPPQQGMQTQQQPFSTGNVSTFDNFSSNTNHNNNVNNGSHMSGSSHHRPTFTTGQASKVPAGEATRFTDLMLLGRLSNLSQGITRLTNLELGGSSGLDLLGRLSGFPNINVGGIGSNSTLSQHGQTSLNLNQAPMNLGKGNYNHDYGRPQSTTPQDQVNLESAAEKAKVIVEKMKSYNQKYQVSKIRRHETQLKDPKPVDFSDPDSRKHLVERQGLSKPQHVVGLNSLDLFMSFAVEYYDPRQPEQSVYDTTEILSRACYDAWIQTRRSKLKKPEESFRRALTAHVTGADRRRPFPPLIEKSILVDLRKQRTWACFEGRLSNEGKEVKIGEQGFRTMGYHEKRAYESSDRHNTHEQNHGSFINTPVKQEESGSAKRKKLDKLNNQGDVHRDISLKHEQTRVVNEINVHQTPPVATNPVTKKQKRIEEGNFAHHAQSVIK